MPKRLRVEYAVAGYRVMGQRDGAGAIFWDGEDRGAGHLQASLIQNLPGCRLKLVPSWKERIGCVEDVAQQAFPLQCGSLDVASADGVGFFFQGAQSAAPMLG